MSGEVGVDSARDDGPSDRDSRLGKLIEQLLSQARAGAPAEVEDLAARHPDLAGELRELWETALLAEAVGSRWGDAQAGDRFGAPSPVTLPANTTLGDYELLETLGQGGMGVVYRARQASLGRIVALKMVLRGSLASATDLARFRGEAQSAARLRHPHIVPVFEVDEHDGLPFFTMQYIAGRTLAQRLADGPLAGREAARLLAPIARAIAEAHRQGVLHRDLKPSNILIDVEGRPYVSDFGLAKRWTPDALDETVSLRSGPATLSGAVLGTPSYMSPEQAAGSRGTLGPASDVYSLGALLYAMLTGRPPFQSPSPVTTILMVLEQDPISPRALNPQIDRDLEMIALKALQKPPELRYHSAEDMADDLDRYLANEPVSARSSHFTQIVVRALAESHHVGVLENWGLLWMLHAIVLLVLCLVTNGMQLSGVQSRAPYVGLWTIGLGTWAAIFWGLRRRAGPVTFIERQIAHVWAGSMIADTLLYAIEWQLGLKVLTLSPVLGPVSGMVFLVKAAMLSGKFYVQAGALFATGLAMAWLQQQTMTPNFAIALFGVVSSVCFFAPGWKYYRAVRGKQT